MSSGCDFVLNETQSHFDEIKIISEYCKKSRIPFLMSFFFNNDLKLLSGEDLFDVVEFVLDKKPLAIGFNCVTFQIFRKALKKINSKYNWGFYLNCGGGNYTDKIIKCTVSPKHYVNEVKVTSNKNPSFIGSCCGSSPAHIKEVRRFLDGRIKN
jgi:S-methylmethionine-dependent homocysteine/selenocysteine methylase